MRVPGMRCFALAALLLPGLAGAETWGVHAHGADLPPGLQTRAAEIIAAEKGNAVVDLAREYQAIAGLLQAGELDSPAPKSLSPKAQAAWRAGLEVCRVRTRGGSVKALERYVAPCVEEVSRVVWQLHLEERGLDRILEIEVGRWKNLNLTHFEPAAARAKHLGGRQVESSALVSTVERLTRSALKGIGTEVLREVSRELPPHPGKDPVRFEGYIQYSDPFEIPADCASKLPATLVVSPPESPVSDSISDSWVSTLARARIRAGAGEWKCEAMNWVSNRGGAVNLGFQLGWMECEGEIVLGKSRASIMPEGPSARLKFVESVLMALVDRTCGLDPGERRRSRRRRR